LDIVEGFTVTRDCAAAEATKIVAPPIAAPNRANEETRFIAIVNCFSRFYLAVRCANGYRLARMLTNEHPAGPHLVFPVTARPVRPSFQ